MLEIRNLSFAYGKKAPVLRDITLSIDAGFHFLIGENGSGKTTLIKTLTGLLSPQWGDVRLDGIPVSDIEYRKKISYLPQSFNVYPSLTVREILRFVASAKSGLEKAELERQISNIMSLTHTADYAHKKLKNCSEGMRRRVGIAAALVGDPEVVILDEPTAGIDPKERFQFYRTIRACFEGKTVLISTHILDDIDFLATHVIMLSKGRVKFTGKYSDFLNALTGKVFEISCDSTAANAILQRYQVLSVSRSGNSVLYKIVSDAMPEDDPLIKTIVPAEAAAEDIWLYFQHDGEDNA